MTSKKNTLTIGREELLDALLAHVPFDGWSTRALRAGAEDLGLDAGDLQRLFPGGPAEAIRFFSSEADRRMLESLAGLDLAAMKVRERVAAAVRLRLETLSPHREAVRRGISFFALPANGPLGVSCLYRSVDAVWQGIGDRSTDYNFYSKRLLLAGVYSSTLMFWLNDRSEGQDASWAFLDRRIGEVLKIGGRFGKTFGRILNLPDRILAKRACP
jgi:ubiquinone biosynthesis protein COQ9